MATSLLLRSPAGRSIKAASFRAAALGSVHCRPPRFRPSRKASLDATRHQVNELKQAASKVRKHVDEQLEFVLKYIGGPDSSYKEALSLRLEAFYRRHHVVILGGLGSAASLFLWQVSQNLGTGFSQGSVLLVLAASSVVSTGLVLRTRYTISPDAVRRVAMREVQRSPALLEVLGNPIVGGDVTAFVTSGGSLKLREFKPRVSCNRCFLTFPVQGYERQGIVSGEVIKAKGQYHVKLLAVDIPTPRTVERFFIIGADEGLRGGSISELLIQLREATTRAVAAKQELDHLDELDELEAKQRGSERPRLLQKLIDLTRYLRQTQVKA